MRTLITSRNGCRPRLMQDGQALVESLVAMLALAVLWVALLWLAHYQDINLSALHASRHAAFVATRIVADEPPADLMADFFTGDAHRWADRRGQAVLDTETPALVSWQRLQPLPDLAQPGGSLAQAVVLRHDWSLADSGILQARVTPLFSTGAIHDARADGYSRLGLDVFDHAYPPLARSTSILTGAGHASSDTAVQDRVAASGLAWSLAHSASRLAGSQAWGRADGVDAGWNRPAPDFEWLRPWSGRVPGHLVTEYVQADQKEN